jgi:hypothetical protein
MTGLLILIIVLLIAIIVWLIGITVLYAQIVRNFKKLATTDENAMRALFNSHTGMLQLVRETLDAMDAVNILVQEYRKAIDAELENNSRNTRFALNTIQQARRIYNQVSALTAESQEQPEEEEEQNG